VSTLAARTWPRVARVGAALRTERLPAALALATAYVWLCFLYATESWGHIAPWLFSDELEYSQLSRAVAETGHAARRGEPHSFQSLYTFLIAPVWWLHDTGAAYAAAKLVGVVVMTSVLFPVYALARMIVSRPAAVFAAVASASIPALYYSSFIFEEPLAYPWSALCLFLIVKALATRARWWVAGAVTASLAAPFIRDQLVVIPAAFALAACTFFWVSERAKRMRAGWSRWDWTGGIVLTVGAAVVINAFASQHSFPWLVATRAYKDRMFENGLWAVGAFTIGVGVLPVIAGLAALVRPRGEQVGPELRAFLATAAAFTIAFAWYTAIKAAYISTVFSTLTVERNLIYVAPALFVATALFFERPRLRLWALAGAAALALYVILTTPYQMQLRLYADAPGLAILQAANAHLSWTPERAKQVLIGMFVVSIFLCLLPRAIEAYGRRALKGVFALAAAGIVAWNVTGQIAAATGANFLSDLATVGIERPLDWIDRATDRTPSVYIGQSITDPNGIWQLEFWNRSVVNVWSVDGTAPGPGPVLTPDLIKPNGTITQPRSDVRYAVVESGVDIVGDLVKTQSRRAGEGTTSWLLYKIHPPLRLRSSVRGIYPDGWVGRESSYSHFWSRGNRPGWAVVTASRKGWGGEDKPGNVVVRLGPLELGPDHQPRIERVTRRCSARIHRLQLLTFVVRTPPPPFQIRVTISPTFSPHELDPRISDVREFGAQVGYGFTQTEPARAKASPDGPFIAC
jgi:hypothetical protein